MTNLMELVVTTGTTFSHTGTFFLPQYIMSMGDYMRGGY